jgi:hypothetical protein
MINVLLLNTPSGANPPGLVEVNIALADKVISIPDVNDNHEIISNLVLEEGASLYRFFTASLDASYDGVSKDSPDGEFFDHGVSFPYPQISPKIHKFLKKFDKTRELILIIKDLHLNSWLIGTKDFPIFRKVKESTGGDSGFNGYKLDFNGSTPDRALYFTGELIVTNPSEDDSVTMVEFDELDFSDIDFY